MSGSLNNFRVERLHDRPRTIDIPIRDNRLILVGENGTGKSTVANLLYYLLTQQWRRIAEYRFKAIQATVGSETVRFTHEDIETLVAHQQGVHLSRNMRVHYPARAVREVYRLMADDLFLFEETDERTLQRISDVVEVPKEVARQILLDFRESQTTKLKREMVAELKRLESWAFGQFLYLPTYRRIEQDLKSIFRGIEIEEKIREFRDRFRKRDKSSYIELIEFGMEDVEKTIQAKMSQIKESVRTGLGTLTGTYLREVIRGLQDNPDVSILKSIDLTAFQSMLARIDEAILPSADKAILNNKLADISSGYTLRPDDKVIAHFLSKLVSLYKEQQSKEIDVRDFVRICNEYLTGKEFVYDELHYEIYIRQVGPDVAGKGEGERLPLKALSSGEKQIVSLFSHIYLSGEQQFFVVIDEPELSLSVPWQQRFLPDIMDTGRCSGLVAVTHSPFIWENTLEPYVRSLAEYIERAHVLH